MKIVKYQCDVCKRVVGEEVGKETFNSASYTSISYNWNSERVIKQSNFEDVCYSCLYEINEAIFKAMERRIKEETINEN